MDNLKTFNQVIGSDSFEDRENPISESEQSEKTEKIQVLLSKEDLTDLGRKISKEALTKGEAPVSVSHYVRKLIRKNLGKTTTD